MSHEIAHPVTEVDDESPAADMWAYLGYISAQVDPVDYCVRQAEDLAIARMEDEGIAEADRKIMHGDGSSGARA